MATKLALYSGMAERTAAQTTRSGEQWASFLDTAAKVYKYPFHDPASLAEVSRTAEARMERMMEELTKKDPPPDKATDQMGWVGHMNSLRHQAEEVILAELIYS